MVSQNSDVASIIVGTNVLLYFLVHIPIEILTYKYRMRGANKKAKNYRAWEGDPLAAILTLTTTLVFWFVFLSWPVLHWTSADSWILEFSVITPPPLQIVGAALVFSGTFLACSGRVARGREAMSWGVPERLATSGGYRIVRHPLYGSYVLYFVGIPILFSNLLLLVLIFGIWGYYRTAKMEEEILVKEFGEEYRNYQQRVGMLLPLIGKKKI